MKGSATLIILTLVSSILAGAASAAYYQSHVGAAGRTFGAQTALTAFQGGTGTSSPSGILYGDETISLKTLGIGSGLSFSGGILSATSGSSGFSTTSANFWSGAGLGFSTTSTNYWKSVTDLFSTSSAAYFLTSTTSLPQLAAVKNTLTGTLAANAGMLYTQATTTASCSGTVSCSTFTVTGSSPVTITGSGGGGGSFPFSADTNYGQVVYSTSTPTLWLKNGIFASSTSHFVDADFSRATTSALAIATLYDGTTGSPGNSGLGNFLSSRASASGNIGIFAAYGTGAASIGPGVNGFSARGTEAVPTASQLNDYLYFMGGRGFGTSVWNTSSKAAISMRAAETHTDTANGTYIMFETTPLLSTTRAERVRIDSTGNVGVGTSSPYARLSVAGETVAQNFTATSTTLTSTFPFASTTAISGTTVCIGTDCRTAWPTSGSGGTGAATSSFAATFPVTLTTSASAITYGYSGLTSSTPWSTGNLAGITNGNTLYGVSTSTLTPSAPLSGSFTQIGSAGSLSITQANASTNGYLSSTDWQSFNSRLSTSTLAILVGQGQTFSTTSANAWSAVGLGFSTTSNTYWKSITDFFSTTSANSWSVNGLGFSTTSTDYWASLKNYATFSYLFPSNATTTKIDFNGGLTATNASTTAATTTNFAITALNCTSFANGGALTTTATGAVVCSDDDSGAGGSTFPFTPTINFGALANATNTPIWFQAGLQASSTSRIASTTFDINGRILVGTSTLTTSNPAALTIDTRNLPASEEGIAVVGNVNDFLETNVINLNSGTAAQACQTATTNTGTLTSGFVSLCANNSNFWNPQTYNVGGPGDISLMGLSTGDLLIAQGTSGKNTYFLNGGVSTSTNLVMSFNSLNVGIGTSSPYTKLSVVGQIVAASFTATTSANNTLPNLTSTSATTTFATTTNLSILSLLNCNSGNKLATNAAGAVICDTDQTGAGGGAFPFTTLTNFAAVANATTTALWAQGSLFASSTVYFGTTTKSAFSFNGTTGKINIGGDNFNTSPAQITLGSGCGNNINPNIMLVACNTVDARMGALVGDTGTFMYAGSGSTYGGVFAYNYSAAALNLVFNEFGGKVSVGSTTPWGYFSVQPPSAMTAADYLQPLFVIATSSSSFGQLITAFATTTTMTSSALIAGDNSSANDTGVRVIIGNSFSGRLSQDQLQVNGRINTGDWFEIECQGGIGNVEATIGIDTSNACGGWGFQEDNNGDFQSNQNNALAAIVSLNFNTANNGAGLFAYSSANFAAATNTPILEASILLTSVGTSTRYVGMTNVNPSGTTFETAPTRGCYFTASSTQSNWQAMCHSSASAMTIFDTGIPTSTTEFTRFRVEMTANEGRFYVQGTSTSMRLVGVVSGANFPTARVVPGIYVANTQTNITGFANIQFQYLRLWYKRTLWPN